IRPDPGDSDGKGRDEQVAVRVRAGSASSAPVHAGQVGSSAVVRAAAEIDQPLRAVDQGGEQVRGDNIDWQDLSAGVDAGVVNHRVEVAELVDIVGHSPCLVQVGQ